MVPICLVTGFLGTGKTTFLKKIVAQNRSRKIVYLINEFAVHDIDGALVSAENPHVVSIPGGSIFCRCLVTEFIGQLKQALITWPDVEGVVIEASGMANPSVIESMLVETGLDKSYRLATILSVIDPNSFLKLRHTLPNILAQVEAADVVLVNKTDCNPPERVLEAVQEVRDLNPLGELIQTVRCNVEVDLFGTHAPRGLHGEYAKCRDPNYATFVTEKPYDGDALEAFIIAHCDEIYRVKGALAGEIFDYSTAGVVRSEHVGATPVLAWIVRGGSSEQVQSALERLVMSVESGD